MGNPILAPSILASDFSRLGDECRRVAEAGADWIHVDVMDGHFVPNITIGVPVVQSLKPATDLPLDVHLMIADPDRYVSEFIAAGADWITFHVEAARDAGALLDEIHAAGKRGGVALKPGTPVDETLELVPRCDMVLVMTVEPGFGGQSFMEEPLAKIPELRRVAAEHGRPLRVEVDGGIDLVTLPTAQAAGADVFVAGSAIFGAADVPKAVADFRSLMLDSVGH